MDPERETTDRPTPKDDRPVEADLLPVAEPDAEVAVAYAAWRLDRAGDPR